MHSNLSPAALSDQQAYTHSVFTSTSFMIILIWPGRYHSAIAVFQVQAFFVLCERNLFFLPRKVRKRHSAPAGVRYLQEGTYELQ